ncbi:unnamed protein product [Paramecium octaurelia]|uniref:Casein kinase I n=1 Tax=Paramecium octaurelia TaxID=43137 RepID=A0A8S1Y746_PAROT|nr:unnamed protein product [Paramecium octaurelia]
MRIIQLHNPINFLTNQRRVPLDLYGKSSIFRLGAFRLVNQKKKQIKVGFTQLITSGQDHMNTYFIMDLLGDNLEQVRTKFGNFNTAAILETGQQMILLLKELHNAQIIHRDIKPENFVVHHEKLYLIDFGLSKLVIQDGIHLEFRENKGMIGTARYASINALKGYEQSRRDDLESVGYLLIYFIHGNSTIEQCQRR